MSVLRLDFDISNTRNLPYTMLGMGDKLKAYQQNLINKKNELLQLKDNGQDERSLDKRIACVEGMIDFWYRRNMALRNGNMMWFPAEDAAFDRSNKSFLREGIDARSVDENRDYGNVVSRKHFRDLCEYGRKVVLKSKEFYHYQNNTELSRLRKIHGNLHKYFIMLHDLFENIHRIAHNPYPDGYMPYTLSQERDFVILLGNIQITLPNSGLDIFELKESAQKLMDDNTKVSDNSAWDFIFDFFYDTHIEGHSVPRFTFNEKSQQWELDNIPLSEIFGDITNDHINAVRLIEKSFSNITESEWEESIRPIVGPESLSVQKANFDKEIEIMNKELENI